MCHITLASSSPTSLRVGRSLGDELLFRGVDGDEPVRRKALEIGQGRKWNVRLLLVELLKLSLMLTIIARSSPFEPESTVGRLISKISRSSGRSARYEHSESGCLSFLRPSTKSNAGKKSGFIIIDCNNGTSSK